MQDYIEGIKIAYGGATTTLLISGVAVVLGLVLGLIVALCRTSNVKVLRGIASVYVDVLRGTPLVVQALILYMGLPMLLQSNGIMFTWDTPVIASIIACGVNSSAYVGEIIRSGLQAIDKGQSEAARSLGMSHGQTMKLVVIPQAVKIIIPALGNEFVTLIKETAILSVISVTDITRASMLWASSTFVYFPAYFGTAFVYLTLTIPLSKIMNYVERRMSTDVKS